MRGLDIVVPIHRQADFARACIESLLTHRGEIAERDPRLVLIDDSPGDSAVDELLRHFAEQPSVVTLRNERNVGFVRTANRGLSLAAAKGRDALLVNSDTVSFDGTLRQLCASVGDDPQIGFAAPRSNRAALCSLPHVPAESSAEPAAARRDWETIARHLPAVHVAPTLVGFYLLVTCPVLERAGFLDEAFGPGYEEENDLIMRARHLGFVAVMANHAFVFHHGSGSFAATGLDLTAHRRLNLELLIQRHPGFPSAVRRYEQGPHFRSERVLSGLLPTPDGRLRIAVDLTDVGLHEAGAPARLANVIGRMAKAHADRWLVTVVCSLPVWEEFGFDDAHVVHQDPGSAGLHAVAVRAGASADRAAFKRLSEMAPVNLAFMDDRSAPTAAQQESALGDLHHDSMHALLFPDDAALQTYRSWHPASFAARCISLDWLEQADPDDSSSADRLAKAIDDVLGDAMLYARLVARQELLGFDRGSALVHDEPRQQPEDAAIAAQPLALDDLLVLEGADFVRHAYATLLRRPADAAGTDFYVSRLRGGIDPLDVIDALARSPEGRARGVELPGLTARLAQRRSLLARIRRKVLAR